MGNLCSFDMLVKGSKNNIDKFYDALSQYKDTWIGRGADASIQFNDNMANISGCVKNSVCDALIYDARSMRKQKETGVGRWYWDKEMSQKNYIMMLFVLQI